MTTTTQTGMDVIPVVLLKNAEIKKFSQEKHVTMATLILRMNAQRHARLNFVEMAL